MKRLIILIPTVRTACFTACVVLVLLMGITTANAQRNNDLSSPQSSYSIDWYTIDGGGATASTGGSYSLGGSIGQPEAGSLSGGSYSLKGGFWSGVAINYTVYLPLVLKSF
jgi:hypothetical protein